MALFLCRDFLKTDWKIQLNSWYSMRFQIQNKLPDVKELVNRNTWLISTSNWDSLDPHFQNQNLRGFTRKLSFPKMKIQKRPKSVNGSHCRSNRRLLERFGSRYWKKSHWIHVKVHSIFHFSDIREWGWVRPQMKSFF